MSVRKTMIAGGLLAAAALNVGCAGMSKTAQGGAIGGGLGAGLGAAIGSASGKAGKGALIGGLAGTVVGGLAGNAEDQRDRRALEARADIAEAEAAQVTSARQLTVYDVARLSREGHSDAIIINQIRSTGSVYDLRADDLSYLKANGVSDGVVTSMQNASGRPVVVEQPVHVVHPRPVVVAPPRPVYVRPRRGVHFHVGR